MDIIEKLRDYLYVGMRLDQYEEAITLINDDERLLYYLCYSYNCCEVLHSEGQFSMITNPDSLFKTPESEKAFLIEAKDFIKAVVFDERQGDGLNGRIDNNRTRKSCTEN